MFTVLLVIHVLIAIAMVVVILLQRSEGGALGIGGGGGGMMTSRGAGNILTRATGILAVCFFAASLALALLIRLETGSSSIVDNIAPAPLLGEEGAPPTPTAPAPILDEEPAAPAGPQIPRSE